MTFDASSIHAQTRMKVRRVLLDIAAQSFAFLSISCRLIPLLQVMMQIAQILCVLFVASCARRYEGDHALLNSDDGSHQEGANEIISAYGTVERVAGEIVPCFPRR